MENIQSSIAVFLFLLIHAFQYTHAAIASKGKLQARTYDGFQSMEPVLLPAGTFIPIPGVTGPAGASATSTTLAPGKSSTEVAEIIASALNAILAIEVPQGNNQQNVPSLVARTSTLPAGIQPLSILRLPMGIFIPGDSANGSQTTPQLALKTQITLGLRKAFERLRYSVATGGRNRLTFNYVRTFEGLVPIQPVFIPKGYLIPMSGKIARSTLGGSVRQDSLDEFTTTPVSQPGGIVALPVTQLPGGIFIPHRMPKLPTDLPPQIVPPGNQNL